MDYFNFTWFQSCELTIGHVNNIPTMQFFTGISRNTQSKSYMLPSTDNCVWEFRNNALWDISVARLLTLTALITVLICSSVIALNSSGVALLLPSESIVVNAWKVQIVKS